MSYITAINTANPPFTISQEQSADFSAHFMGKTKDEKRKIRILQRATGIKNRHTVLEDYTKKENFDFYPNSEDLEPFPTTSERMKMYEKWATKLGMEAAKPIIEGREQEITHLITVSCTGMYAPGIDIELLENLGLNSSVQRTAINFMGCYASFNAFKVADAFCKAFDAKVLIVGVELCTLHFQKQSDDDNLLANSIFADGAAAVLVESKPKENNTNLFLKNFYCDLVPKGKRDMAWYIRDTGFEMRLSSYVADILGDEIEGILDKLMKGLEVDKNSDSISNWAVHPGGKKILETLAKKLSMDKSKLDVPFKIWEEYGNMSSVTVLFVLKELLHNKEKYHLKNSQLIPCLAFGPGLTVESALFELLEK
ncbi:type III polyketide synthase [Bernardetia sp. Wsw4-3y2]|uniref:type III polyketide synthase n=1 Tax=unclassified Bernardetia TaxID=2647129 RepID=UPI0030CCEA0F